MGLWADTIKVMKSKLFADTLKNGNYEVDRARKDQRGRTIDQIYATKELAQQYVTDLQQMLVDGEIVVSDALSAGQAELAAEAIRDSLGRVIEDTYVTKLDFNTFGQDLDAGHITVESARSADVAKYVSNNSLASLETDYLTGVGVNCTLGVGTYIFNIERMDGIDAGVLHTSVLTVAKGKITYSSAMNWYNGAQTYMQVHLQYDASKKRLAVREVAPDGIEVSGKTYRLQISYWKISNDEGHY